MNQYSTKYSRSNYGPNSHISRNLKTGCWYRSGIDSYSFIHSIDTKHHIGTSRFIKQNIISGIQVSYDITVDGIGISNKNFSDNLNSISDIGLDKCIRLYKPSSKKQSQKEQKRNFASSKSMK
jgi:hypothetical protein